MNLDEYQNRASRTDQNTAPSSPDDDQRTPHRHQTIPLLGLASEAGELLGKYKKLLRDGPVHRRFRDDVAEELGDILWYVANVATKFELSLNDIAEQNLDKVDDRWLAMERRARRYDAELPEDQRLPDRFVYRFEEYEDGGISKVKIIDEADQSSHGDPLSDNSGDDDGYRYHDAMHLTFAACLGWSPVLRKLLRTKGQLQNRTPRQLADIEDGGRAQVVEEGIVAAAYAYAADHNFLDGAEAVDWHLLRHIKQMTSHLEVGDRSTWHWNDALLRGFAIWRALWQHRGGIVTGDLENGAISFSADRSS